MLSQNSHYYVITFILSFTMHYILGENQITIAVAVFLVYYDSS